VPDELPSDFSPEFVVVDASRYQAEPARDGTRSGTFILVHFGRRIVLIGGTRYAGEIKKSIFTVMNYLMPLRDVLSMHCSANVGAAGDVAIFFGLSGTGKTTLSADTHRPLIGDDEHGWSSDGVFNFEGGCYAKVIRLSQSAEPEIWAASHRFGTVLENVVFDPQSRELDLDSEKKTENTRSAYPLEFIPNMVPGSMGGHPKLTLEQMKQMADVQASALIEKSKTDPKNAALLVQKLRSASVGALQRLTALGARGQAASCRDIYLHLFLTRDAAWCAQGRWHSMQHREYFPPHTKRAGGQHTCFSYDTPFTCA